MREVTLRLPTLARLWARAKRVLPGPSTAPGFISFRCNVCGSENAAIPEAEVRNRECPSCRVCGGSVRMRAIVRALSLSMYGRSKALPDFPVDKSVRGLGISDWDGYAIPLSQKFSYLNTFFDREPRLDISNVDRAHWGQYDFVICSEVFEHIPIGSLSAAFRNLHRLLRPGGACIFTVPWYDLPATTEHFPDLHDFRIEERDSGSVLINKTVTGEIQEFKDLVFHGGGGMTLEMRVFCRADLVRRFREAGFSEITCVDGEQAKFGVLWEISWAFPLIARA